MEGKEYKLVEICDLITCGVAKRPEYFESGIPFLSSKNVKKNKIFFKDYNFISQEMHNELTKKNKPLRGDILYTRVGSFGEAAVIDFDDEFSVFVSLTLIKPKKKIVDAYYLMQFLNSEIVQALAKRSTIGNGVQNLNVNTVREFKIVLPSLSDQIQIANILSKAETLIEQRKQSIALLDEFLKSTFLEMFGEPTRNEKGWEIFSLSDVCLKITDGTHDTPERLTEGIKYITGKHITPFNVDFDNSDYVTEEAHNEIYRRTNVEFDDILYTNIGANVGTAARVKVKYEFSLKNVALLKQNRNKLKSHYLEHLLNNSNFKHKLLSLLSIGGAQKFLNLKSIGKIKIPIPPIELQTQFATIVTKTETLKEQYKNSLQELENLYGSLSQKAFKGELEFSKQTI